MTALPLSLNEMHAHQRAWRWPRLVGRAAAAFLLLAPLFCSSANADKPGKGQGTVLSDGGFTRLAFRVEEAVEASVSNPGGIIVIAFKKPVAIPVDRINGSAPEYISAARRDP